MATKSRATIADRISHLGPCHEALRWAASQSSPKKAWNSCRRGDWMLWLLGKVNKSSPWSDGRKPLLACTLDCACTVRHLWPESQREKIENAVRVLRLWIVGGTTVEQARHARQGLWDARCAAAAYAVYAAAAGAAAAGADAADDADDADAADAAYAAAAAVAYVSADTDAARLDTLRKCAGIVRQHFPDPPEIPE